MIKLGTLAPSVILGSAKARIRYLVIPAMMMALIEPSSLASAATYKVLYSFCAESLCADGSGPSARLLADGSGNLYGTTFYGGAGQGVVFELMPGRNGAWKYKTLHTFCSSSGCADGANPAAPLIMDGQGNLYGTTRFGGAANKGIIFELIPATQRRWKLAVLRSFCSQSGCPDGAELQAGLTYSGASAGLPYDGTSPLYGTATHGGASDNGVIFELTSPAPGKKKWHMKTIHTFCAGGEPCADGSLPLGSLTIDTSNNLFGTTITGGDHNGGAVYELSPSPGKTGWTEVVLYSFCSLSKCADGGIPNGVTMASGNLFGTTFEGGNQTCGGGCGVAFRLSPNGLAWQESVLYTFCALANCADGANPIGDVLLDPSGNLFGTTDDGGIKDPVDAPNGGGTLFEIGASGFQVVFSFCTDGCHNDGASPLAGLIMDSSGNLFGTTANAGLHNGGGTVFEWSP